jgi:hypothetical protein
VGWWGGRQVGEKTLESNALSKRVNAVVYSMRWASSGPRFNTFHHLGANAFSVRSDRAMPRREHRPTHWTSRRTYCVWWFQ